MADAREEGRGDVLPLGQRVLVALDRLHQPSAPSLADSDEDEIPEVPMLGRFVILSRIGSGGMGTVFEAFDPQLGRTVALKICKLATIDAADAIEHEAHCLARLAHPNVVTIYDVIRDGPDVILVMEYVQGRTLRRWQRVTNPTWREILAHYVEAAQGLAAAHDAGLVHGDFKPDNVLVGVDGRVRVIDFGLARYSTSAEPSEIEVANIGTHCYMAPERLRDEPGGVQADVYAFCVAVWESLYGALPYKGNTAAELLVTISAGQPATGEAVPSVCEPIRAVLLAGLSMHASERPASMPVLVRALLEASERDRERAALRWQWAKRGLVVVSVVVLAIVLAMVLREPELSAVEQALVLAIEEARDGSPDDAVQYLELARSRAHRDHDDDALRRVANEAVVAGEHLFDRDYAKQGHDCRDIAHEIFVELGDRKSLELLRIPRR